MTKKEEQKKHTIDDLSELTGYSKRTIRYYVKEGLLEHPAGRGRGGFYFDRHLLQLKMVKKLQEKGMSLSSISKYMEGISRPRHQDYFENVEPILGQKGAEEKFPTAKKRAYMMKEKMDEVLKEKTQKGQKEEFFSEAYFIENRIYELPPESPRNVWARYEIAPGLEISVRRDIEEKQKRKIDDIIRIAREILGKNTSKNNFK
jgi:DNA-binding transcriptional MerR regulator